ncbi:hypothetical protein KFK09_024736 [Dendrobium nobile]|uniref:Pectinesterase inhibitor domain-containing protein n=1 Tax=Dendrobium nobile TaxID=94219 RepID=A0A8T3AK28_DENNO|nr:hypothetical protein KFK09_024736 [Dendrobium nobile]
MKISSLLFALLILLHQQLPTVNASVEKICKQVALEKGGDYDFCLKSLQRDPKSSTASTAGLALIATRRAKEDFRSALATVKKLLRGNITDNDKSSLAVCAEVYDDGVYILREAIGAIRSGTRDDAITYLSASLTDVSTCSDTFDEFAANKTMVAKVDADAAKISTLALEIATLM